jgi:large subunit ribosomal protein L9
MQVILLQDVKGQGKKDDLIDVNEGYARNFLIKKGLAEAATPNKINELKQKKASQDFHKQEEVKAMQALAKELKGKTFTVSIKVGQSGKVFGSVTSAHISDAMKEVGYDVDKKKIVISQPIKNVGEYKVDIKLLEGISVAVGIIVKGLE